MSASENESTTPGIQAELERLRSLAAEGSEEAMQTIARALRKLGPKLAEAVPSTRFDVVLFDVGGVMLTNGWDHNERAVVLQQFNLDKAAFEARHPDPYDALERDTITMLDYLNATVFYEPRPFTPDDFISTMKVQSNRFPQTPWESSAKLPHPIDGSSACSTTSRVCCMSTAWKNTA